MISFSPGRSWLIGGVVALWIGGIVAIFVYAMSRETIVVTHWANGHMTNATLLPRMPTRGCSSISSSPAPLNRSSVASMSSTA